MSLLACAECNRHMRRSETACPFCGARISSAVERPLPSVRLSRKALLAFAAATVGVGCGGKETGVGSSTEPPTGGGGQSAGGAAGRPGSGGIFGSGGKLGGGGSIVAPYGAPPPMGGFGGGIAPPYGIPPGGFGNIGGVPPTGGFGGKGGSGGTLVDSGIPDAASDAGDSGLNCIDRFGGNQPARCCPDPPPDCTSKPDGYPGYACVPPPASFCSCSCQGGMWQCAC